MSVKSLFQLEGKVALITGGSRGLGLQIAEALGEMGCKLAITARKEAELEAAAQHLQSQGVEVLTVPGNLSQFDTIPGLVDRVLDRFGVIDVLVNNAGATWGAPAEDYPDEAWHKVMDLNINAVFYLSREVGRRTMIPRRAGKIITVASAAGMRGTAKGVSTIAYNTSKAAAVNFTRTLACEWGRYNINVNAICPGYFSSRMADVQIQRMGQSLLDRIPLERVGGEEDLKGIAVLLASEASRHITGQAILVDGGASVSA